MPYRYTGTAKENFPDYSKHKCIVGRHLTFEMYERLYRKVTPNGVTLDKVIQPSCDNKGRIIGLIAGDEESYDTFGELFDAVIDELHLGFGPDEKQPPPELDAEKIAGGHLDETYVRSCRVRTARGVRGFCFSPSCTRAERREIERVMVDALSGLEGDLKGKYYPLSTMTSETEKQLIEDHFLFAKPTQNHMLDSSAVRDWPDARGIWNNDEKTFLVWLNEEDHVRIISMQKGGDLKATFDRFCRALKSVENQMKSRGTEFMLHERFGYLCACPSNIGTGLRASVHLQLRNLGKHPKFKAILDSLELQSRGTGGEDTDTIDDIYDISNKARLRKTERQFVQLVIDGVEQLIEMEKRLQKNEKIEDLLPASCL